jgi:hypothetical protein
LPGGALSAPGAATAPRQRWHPGVGAALLLLAAFATPASGTGAWLVMGAAAGFAVSGST